MSDIVAQIVSYCESCGLSVSKKMVEEEIKKLKRSQVIDQYGSKIKQMERDGRYYIRYEGRLITKVTFDRVIDEILKRQNQKGGRTLDSISEEFFKQRYRKCSSGTYGKDMLNYKNYIKGTELATEDITKITTANCYEWFDHCLSVKPHMKEKYFKNIRGTLNQMFRYAKINGWITQNPVAEMDIHRDQLAPATRHQDRELVFSDKERIHVCRLAFADADKTNSALPLAIPLLFQTGLRDGELCALRWRDLVAEGLHIQSGMVENRDEEGKFTGYKHVEHTKTKAGDRIIPITPEVAEIFNRVKKLNQENNFPTEQNDFIFLRIYKGNIIHCTTRCFESRIKKFCKQAGMEVLKSQHDARRTFATNLYYVGMNLKDIQELMGHESPEQTMQYIKKKGKNENALSYLEAISSKNAVAV